MLSDVIGLARVPHRLNAIPLGNHFHLTELCWYASNRIRLGDFIDALEGIFAPKTISLIISRGMSKSIFPDCLMSRTSCSYAQHVDFVSSAAISISSIP